MYLMANAAPATNNAGGGITGAGLLAAALTVLVLVVLLKSVLSNSPTNAPPPDFQPITPAAEALLPPVDSTDSGVAPVNIDIEVDEVDVIRAPGSERPAPRWDGN